MPSSTPSPQAPVVPPRSPDAAAAEPVGVALGRIPSGLFVVTWRDGDRDRGMLASWVMQAGFDPPQLTVAVGRGRDLLVAIEAGAAFVVNVLAESQRSLLGKFGKPGDDPFAGVPLDRTASGIATFAESAAWLECRPVGVIAGATAGGDHAVVCGTVVAAGSAGDRQPMVHIRKNGLRY